MKKLLLAGMLAAIFLVSCGDGSTSDFYECDVTCTISGVPMSSSAPVQETEASHTAAVDACQSKIQAQVVTICGTASATVSCACYQSD